MQSIGLAGFGAVAVAVCSACGSPGNSADPSKVEDAGSADVTVVDASIDATSVKDAAVFAPAAHPAIPLMRWGGASLLTAPSIVTITFANDNARSTIEAFDDTITNSAWWTETTSQYCYGIGSPVCMGTGSGGGHVVLGTPNASYSGDEIDALVRQSIASGVFPAPTSNSIYMMYFPAGVAVGDPGFMSCDAFDGYHTVTVATPPAITSDAGNTDDAADGDPSDASTGDDGGPNIAQVTIVYAVVTRCSTVNELTIAAGHEIAEGASDPGGQGYTMEDPAWATVLLPEIGDLCDTESNVMSGTYAVQRLWSNASAKAGHNPCVPIPSGEVYFAGSPKISAVSLAVGASTTIEIEAWSDAPTPDWNILPIDWNSYVTGSAPTLDLQLDRTSVNNGSIAKLTVKLDRQPDPSDFNQAGYAAYAIQSSRGNATHYWPGIVIPK